MMSKPNHSTLLDLEFRQAEAGVIRTLLYFDIFQYPLTLEELVRFHPYANSHDVVARALADLLSRSVVFRYGHFYSLHQSDTCAAKRTTGNELAKRKLRTARRFSKLLSHFPFIRAVMISGSLSKDYMEKDSDIDYFIITAPGRLWLTRGLLALFKRVFLFNSHKFFCTNYLIDTQSLQIEEQNVYTAMETATLIPTYGKNLSEQFMAQNDWVKQYLPNINAQRTSYIPEKEGVLKKTFEFVFSGTLGEKMDRFLMQVAVKRWKKKFGDSFTEVDFDLAFKSRRGVSKNHPRFFQKRILELFQERVESFEVLNKMKLSA